jgi:peroxiredoxin
MNFVGEPAPEFGLLDTVQGALTPTLQALRGKVVVVEFWASWCQVCSFLVPTMNEWHARFGPLGAVVLGVTVDRVQVAADAAAKLDMRYPLASDPQGTATRAYQARAIPTVFVIYQKGTVRDVLVGFSEERLTQVESLIDELLAGS